LVKLIIKLAYGITSSGKTYTILGDNKNFGLLPRSLEEAFNLIEKYNDLYIQVTYIEVYNEQIIDLLSEQNKNKKNYLQINEKQDGSIIIKGCNQVTVKNIKEAEEVLITGNKNRSVGETELNHDSSRSHSVFTIKLIKKEEVKLYYIIL
jgi:centromeric protein E